MRSALRVKICCFSLNLEGCFFIVFNLFHFLGSIGKSIAQFSRITLLIDYFLFLSSKNQSKLMSLKNSDMQQLMAKLLQVIQSCSLYCLKEHILFLRDFQTCREIVGKKSRINSRVWGLGRVQVEFKWDAGGMQVRCRWDACASEVQVRCR